MSLEMPCFRVLNKTSTSLHGEKPRTVATVAICSPPTAFTNAVAGGRPRDAPGGAPVGTQCADSHQPERTAWRGGSVESHVTLGGRQVGLPRLRVRDGDGEVPLASFQVGGGDRPVGGTHARRSPRACRRGNMHGRWAARCRRR